MSEGLQGRIMHEARRNKNALMTAYAGDLAEMIEELTARAEAAIEQSASANLKLREELADVYRRAERAEAALIGRIELCTELSREIQRLRQRAERAEAALAAVPWQALLNISHALEASDAARDPDEAALLAFLNQYAPWVPNESEG